MLDLRFFLCEGFTCGCRPYVGFCERTPYRCFGVLVGRLYVSSAQQTTAMKEIETFFCGLTYIEVVVRGGVGYAF